MFDPEVCTFTRGNVDVEMQGDRTRGLTWWKADAEGKHLIATKVDRDRFFKEYFSVFKNQEEN